MAVDWKDWVHRVIRTLSPYTPNQEATIEARHLLKLLKVRGVEPPAMAEEECRRAEAGQSFLRRRLYIDSQCKDLKALFSSPWNGIVTPEIRRRLGEILRQNERTRPIAEKVVNSLSGPNGRRPLEERGKWLLFHVGGSRRDTHRDSEVVAMIEELSRIAQHLHRSSVEEALRAAFLWDRRWPVRIAAVRALNSL